MIALVILAALSGAVLGMGLVDIATGDDDCSASPDDSAASGNFRLCLKSCQGFVDGRRSRVHAIFVNMKEAS
jgi:hypothetical protein